MERRWEKCQEKVERSARADSGRALLTSSGNNGRLSKSVVLFATKNRLAE